MSVPPDMYDVMSQMIFMCLFLYLFNYITLCLSLVKSDHICTFMYEIHEQTLLNEHILKLHEKPAISQVVRTDSANIYHTQEGDRQSSVQKYITIDYLRKSVLQIWM